jgi:RNA polymerase sigma-70 factor (ECF subfamily)
MITSQSGKLEFADQDLIHLLRKGDMAAYEKVFKNFQRPLHVYAFLMVKDEVMAADIVQEIFYRIWLKREKLSIQHSLKAYLYACVHHESLLQLKKQKRLADYETMMLHREKYEAPAADASERLRRVELEESITVALNRLPEQCRTIFQLNRFEKLKYREVAAVLGISVKTVESQMGKALKILRISLSEFLPFLIFIVCHL